MSTNDLNASLAKVLRDLETQERDPEYATRERELREREEEGKRGLSEAEEREWKRITCLAAPVRSAVNAFSGEQTPAIVAVQEWLAKPSRPGLVLRGGVGCGKTSAACYAVREWLGRPTGRWVSDEFSEKWFYRFTHASRDSRGNGPRPISWFKPDQLVSAVMHSYDPESPKLHRHVVIDDMGRETKADFAEALCELLDTPGHTILITTNMNRAQMRERYDLRLLDRLNDVCVAVDLPGKSMRRQDGGF